MRILSLGKKVEFPNIDIDTIEIENISNINSLESYDYIIIHGGDGTLRRTIKTLRNHKNFPPIILNTTGSFNVIAKMHNIKSLNRVLNSLANGENIKLVNHDIYGINDEIFLFSSGNMGNLQHIFLAESLRFGILEHGSLKYLLSFLFLLPLHIIMSPFMLMSKRKFFIFTPASFIGKFGSFYGKVQDMIIDLENSHNLIELDGDIVTFNESKLLIKKLGSFNLVNSAQ